MIELGPEDHAKIVDMCNVDDTYGLPPNVEDVYRAGIEAGLERAARICETAPNTYAAEECAEAIRRAL